MTYKNHVPSLNHLIEELKKWPGIGPRSAARLSVHLLKTKVQDIESLRQALRNIKTKIKKCASCFTFTEDCDVCRLCSSSRRTELLCVVEEPFDIVHIESSGKFQGRYHVLHGALSPLNHTHPEHLTITALMEKIKSRTIKEVILALDADLEGDMTALYLKKLIAPYQVKVSRLANGIPFGGDIDYIDEQTLGTAMERRVEM